MRLFYLLIVAFSSLLAAANAQQRGMGLILDEAEFRAMPKLSPNVNWQKADNLTMRVSLKNYCPTPGDQGATGSCVGWASAYGMTICRAIQENITDKTIINKMAHSAMYVYSKIKNTGDCKAGSTLSKAVTLMKNEGVCRASTFDNVATNCAVVPPPNAVAEAANFRIKDYVAAFNWDATPLQRRTQIRQLLAQRNPVIVGIKIYDSFYKVSEGQKIWSPQPNEALLDGGHAVIVVGYDEFNKRFEIMNSWGPKWGDGGFISISYDDFDKLLMSGFMIILEEKQTAKLSGAFTFRYPTPAPNGGDALFEEAKTQYNPAKNCYELARKDWKAGETVFQIVARNIPKGKYVYAFSVDAAGKADIHFPLNPKEYVNFMPSADAEIILPDADNALLLSVKGEDNLCILYCDNVIVDFPTRFERLKTTKGNFRERLNAAFADMLIAENKIKYAPNAMSFESSKQEGDSGFVVPIVLTVDAQ
jgi:Papain family cysteine protease